jgi:hypothetical protein
LAVKNHAIPTFVTPPDPAAGATRGEECICEKLIDEYVRRINYIYYFGGRSAADITRQKIEAQDNCETISTTGD